MKKILSIFSVSFALIFSTSAFANTIGVVYDSGGKFDKSFNELASVAHSHPTLSTYNVGSAIIRLENVLVPYQWSFIFSANFSIFARTR